MLQYIYEYFGWSWQYAIRQSQSAHVGESPIDIVQENADLAGQWPENVTVLSVQFAHGGTNAEDLNNAQAIVANWQRLGAVLIDAEQVGIELVSGLAPEQVGAVFAALNANVDRLNDGEATGLEAHNGLELGLIGIISGMRRAGARKLPHFFPIDAFAHPEIGQAAHILTNPTVKLSLKDRAMLEASSDRARESLALRQTCQTAKAMAVDGQQHRLAIVQGNIHYRTGLAAAALGAHVETAVVDKPVVSPLSLLRDRVREDGTYVISEEVAELHANAEVIGELIFAAGGGQEKLRGLVEHARQVKQVAMVTQLGLVSLDGLQQRLGPEAQEAFNALLGSLETGDQGAMALSAARLFGLIGN